MSMKGWVIGGLVVGVLAAIGGRTKTEAQAVAVAPIKEHVSRYELMAGAVHSKDTVIGCTSPYTLNSAMELEQKNNWSLPEETLLAMDCVTIPAKTAALPLYNSHKSVEAQYRMEVQGADVVLWAYGQWE